MPAVKAWVLRMLVGSRLVGALTLAHAAVSMAADGKPIRDTQVDVKRPLPVKAIPAPAVADWTGFYLGAHTGLGRNLVACDAAGSRARERVGGLDLAGRRRADRL